MDRLLQLVVAACDVPAAVVSLTHDGDQVVLACRGIGALKIGSTFPDAVPLSGNVPSGGLPLIVEDTDSRHGITVARGLGEYGLRSYAALPVRDDSGEVFATLTIGAPWPRFWCTAELRAVDTATQLLPDLLAFHIAHLHKGPHRLAVTPDRKRSAITQARITMIRSRATLSRAHHIIAATQAARIARNAAQ
ncbi:GAF domain-containing protein [Actinoplanes sp. Pm04-4]|uniref:GAF domain-containing protein n=1 Tax=Paractinoplanes pyxinae TaxID=2997416 RepID=A0ABT4BGN0_9ACTN|nr:GAF domain-containing protein [Actinoplanes pyxinae]MCY1145689.1 GAF domain-containing protein [Actinoplanes pyxinae]